MIWLNKNLFIPVNPPATVDQNLNEGNQFFRV
jgi:hypothetical protein